MKAVILSLVFIGAACCCSAQKIKPALHLEKNHTYYLIANSNSAITQSIGGQQGKVSIILNWKMSFTVNGIKDSVYTMDASYQSLSTKIEQAGGFIDFDSKRNDPTDKPSMVFAAVINKPVQIEITSSGKVKSVSNADKLIQEAMNSVTQLDTTKQAQVKALLEQYFEPETLKGYIETGISVFPAGMVNRDDKWKIDIKRQSPSKMTLSINYQLTDIVKNLYLVHGEGTISTDKNAGVVHINGMPVKYNLNGSLISDVRLDRTTGWVSTVRTTQLMVGDMQIQDNPNVPGGMSIPVSFNTDITISGN
ncbi:DUF6263 family protein [Mucilaginibacter sp. L3T2-6]|uniref:DUF6263 family protein n=1 Tax=Mucilaginibacter sp. L3T2-6 TaxID=3062491 RepID=UPI0026774075|nr:DUF6263 family protein [Mucilaginibacter sp. L3T2-6]MDO3644855.1 DUF6263 family protein [Mucilaginibacter sp. L3T2-6]MDV6217251.1 DUF6263 family protein [Mucilaginibacter sp. L3T2-6]